MIRRRWKPSYVDGFSDKNEKKITKDYLTNRYIRVLIKGDLTYYKNTTEQSITEPAYVLSEIYKVQGYRRTKGITYHILQKEDDINNNTIDIILSHYRSLSGGYVGQNFILFSTRYNNNESPLSNLMEENLDLEYLLDNDGVVKLPSTGRTPEIRIKEKYYSSDQNWKFKPSNDEPTNENNILDSNPRPSFVFNLPGNMGTRSDGWVRG